ncbi:phosphotransferase family protein [Sphingomonas sp. ID0503]|uniref:phosphotransferase family protein n=1 Tax=Sphingomonas sp. ID0503 TaxID=3399691 RepID=UPI003AFA27E6
MSYGTDRVAEVDGGFDPFDKDDLEPGVRRVLERRAARKRGAPPYRPRAEAPVEEALARFLATAAPDARIEGLKRLGGGASKEQFSFHIAAGHPQAGRYVLRMEPLQSISESDRRREFEVLRAFGEIVPAPVPVWLDAEGEVLGQPAAIMKFVGGVTKPSENVGGVTGLGTILGDRLRPLIAPQFIDCLARIHGYDWEGKGLDSFEAPTGDPRRAALWQLNWWSQVWREDRTQSFPVMALAERWMRRNLPAADDIVLVHGDYRTGNYLFDEADGRITALLDWELCHLGDFHEDIAWMLQRLFGSVEHDRQLAAGLLERGEMIAAYEAASGRKIDRRTLHFYEVFSAYKCIVITMATGVKAARDRHNHQEVLLTWLAPIGHIFAAELADLLKQEPGL